MPAETLVGGRGEAHRIDAPRCALGESPRWGNGRWWWVDATAGILWSATSDFTQIRREFVTGDRISLVLPAVNHQMVITCGKELVVFDPQTQEVTPWAQIELKPDWVLNDGTVDGQGALWVGSVHPRSVPGTGLIHRISPEGAVSTSLTGTQLSNGMTWTADGHLLHADSLARKIFSRCVNIRTGKIGSSCVAWEVPESEGLALPDGLSIDKEGGLWVALYGAGKVVRVIDGIVAEVITVPTAQTTSAALGGIDGRDLLITTAQEGMTEGAVVADPQAGALFRARVRIPGASVPLVRLPSRGK